MADLNRAWVLREIDARRICVIKPSALGDVVQALPILPALRARFPLARISWVINRSLGSLLEGHPDLDEIVAFERRGSLVDWGRLLARLRRSRSDLVFDLQGLLRTAVMAWASGAPLRVGLETAREGSQHACHFSIPGTSRGVAAHARYRRVAESLGVAVRSTGSRLAIGAGDVHWARRHLAALKGPVLAVQPGARWPTKRWPPEKFAAVAAKAAARYAIAPVLLGAPDEAPLALQVEQAMRRIAPGLRMLNLAGQTTLKQLAALLQQSSVLLTNDSGPMHLAAELGTSVVAVFTCTSPVRSGPPGALHELVATGVPCAASYRKRCPHHGSHHLACLDELDVERVWGALDRLMQRRLADNATA
jgi:lipopolysaccharide heptosyltransferase II